MTLKVCVSNQIIVGKARAPEIQLPSNTDALYELLWMSDTENLKFGNCLSAQFFIMCHHFWSTKHPWSSWKSWYLHLLNKYLFYKKSSESFWLLFSGVTYPICEIKSCSAKHFARGKDKAKYSRVRLKPNMQTGTHCSCDYCKCQMHQISLIVLTLLYSQCQNQQQ